MEVLPRGYDPLSADWVAGVLLSCLLILATINVGSPRKWRVLRQAAFRLRLGRQLLREESDASDRNLLGLQAVAVVCMALLLWQAGIVFGSVAPPAFMFMVLGVGSVLLLQAGLLRLVAWVARSGQAIQEYLYTGSLLHIAVGLSLLPLVALVAYRPVWREPLLAAGLSIVACGLLYRWVRALVIGLGSGVFLRYIFLYLCAAEIMPLALALQALQQASQTATTP